MRTENTISKAKPKKGLTKGKKTNKLRKFNFVKWDGFDEDIEKLKAKHFQDTDAGAIKTAIKKDLAQ